MGEITMPRLSDTMSEGTVGRWLKKPGDAVAMGEIIAEIETDKATMELESFEVGTFSEIIIGEGQTVPIGTVIAYIGDGRPAAAAPAAAPAAAEPAPAPSAPPAPAPAAAAPAPAAPSAPAAVQAPPAAVQPQTNGHSEDERVKASPLARRIAEEQGVDLHLVVGTGPGGRIIKENIEEYIANGGARAAAAPAAATDAAPTAPAAPAPAAKPAPTPAAAPAPTLAGAEPLGRMRKAIARAMNDSKPGVPHIYVTMEIDMDAAMALREQIIASGTKISVNDMVVKAAAKALVKLPAVNTSYGTTAEGQPGIVRHQQINVSVAVALDDGLIAPVVKDADKKSVGTISAEIREMALRARDGKIKQNEIEGATFQVTNLGMFGVTEFGSIITVPQSASLAVGAVRKIPVVRNDAVVVGQVMNVTLSADHRIVDGAVAAQYLQALKKLLEAPMTLLV